MYYLFFIPGLTAACARLSHAFKLHLVLPGRVKQAPVQA